MCRKRTEKILKGFFWRKWNPVFRKCLLPFCLPVCSWKNSDWVPLTTLPHCKPLKRMAAISRYMELTIEPVQQVSGREPQPGAQKGGGWPWEASWRGDTLGAGGAEWIRKACKKEERALKALVGRRWSDEVELGRWKVAERQGWDGHGVEADRDLEVNGNPGDFRTRDSGSDMHFRAITRAVLGAD